MLVARIDLLAPAEKAALQAASVIGRVFWTGPVYELLGGLEPDFRILEERDFVRRRPGSSMAGEREYVIKHALTREVAYGSVPKARRARLHADFAEWLETVGGSRDEHASLLAYHYATAVRPEDADLAWAGDEDELERLRRRAVAWLARAAELATHRYELREAHALLAQALDLEGDDRSRIDLLRQVAGVHFYNYEMQPFRHTLEEALALGPDRPIAAEIYSLLAEIGVGRVYMWTHPPPADVADGWLAAALELAEPGTEAHAVALATRALATPETGAEAAEEALAVAEALGTPSLLLMAYEAKALVASAAGQFEEACGWADRTLALLPTGDPGDRAYRLWPAGCIYLRGGWVDKVAPLADQCDRLSALLTPHDEVHALALRTTLYHATGQWAGAGRTEDGRRAGGRGERGNALPVRLALAPHLRSRAGASGREEGSAAARRGRPREGRRRGATGARARADAARTPARRPG